mmetsp:Transcript_12699/g.27696  ORF Transcript_12699/g.27696 Transcript_12699/m.27696 type:complete len:174 (+) Transcript_12699:79-600(+)
MENNQSRITSTGSLFTRKPVELLHRAKHRQVSARKTIEYLELKHKNKPEACSSQQPRQDPFESQLNEGDSLSVISSASSPEPVRSARSMQRDSYREKLTSPRNEQSVDGTRRSWKRLADEGVPMSSALSSSYPSSEYLAFFAEEREVSSQSLQERLATRRMQSFAPELPPIEE